MHEAYAVIYTTPFVIAALGLMCLFCWAMGQLRAQYLWDLEEEACDMEDELLYVVHQKSKEVSERQKSLCRRMEELFDFSDVDKDLKKVIQFQMQEEILL